TMTMRCRTKLKIVPKDNFTLFALKQNFLTPPRTIQQNAPCGEDLINIHESKGTSSSHHSRQKSASLSHLLPDNHNSNVMMINYSQGGCFDHSVDQLKVLKLSSPTAPMKPPTCRMLGIKTTNLPTPKKHIKSLKASKLIVNTWDIEPPSFSLLTSSSDDDNDSDNGTYNEDNTAKKDPPVIGTDDHKYDNVIIISSQDSPEVEICLERNFRSRNKAMCNISDQLYDRLNGPKISNVHSGSPSGGKDRRHGPSRFICASKYKESPYNELPKKIFASEIELQLFNSIVKISNVEKFKYQWAIEYTTNVRVAFTSLAALQHGSFFDNYVINAFCRKLFLDNHPDKSKKHFFFHTCSEYFLEKWSNQYRKNQLETSLKKSFDGANYARKINTCDYLFFPLLYNNHWFLFVVDIKNGLWIFLDSLFFEDDQFHKDVRKVLIDFQGAPIAT
ncbi:hypothetical protein E2562_002259, partial [Oryza meyeriana var. granulata]